MGTSNINKKYPSLLDTQCLAMTSGVIYWLEELGEFASKKAVQRNSPVSQKSIDD